MSQEPNYSKIGAFVLGAVGLVVGLVVLAGTGLFGKPMVKIETYIDGSVQGLTVGAPVKFRGVVVGRVKEIDFTTNVYEQDTPADRRHNYVLVLMEVDSEVMDAVGTGDLQADINQEVARGLRVRMSTSGLTGVASMDIDYLDPQTNRLLPFEWATRHLYIPSAPSDFSRLLKSAETVFRNLEKVDINSVVVQATNLLVEVRQSNESLGSLITRFDRVVTVGQQDIEGALLNLQQTTDNINDLTSTLKGYPADIIFGSPPPPSTVVQPSAPKDKKK